MNKRTKLAAIGITGLAIAAGGTGLAVAGGGDDDTGDSEAPISGSALERGERRGPRPPGRGRGHRHRDRGRGELLRGRGHARRRHRDRRPARPRLQGRRSETSRTTRRDRRLTEGGRTEVASWRPGLVHSNEPALEAAAAPPGPAHRMRRCGSSRRLVAWSGSPASDRSARSRASNRARPKIGVSGSTPCRRRACRARSESCRGARRPSRCRRLRSPRRPSIAKVLARFVWKGRWCIEAGVGTTPRVRGPGSPPPHAQRWRAFQTSSHGQRRAHSSVTYG